MSCFSQPSYVSSGVSLDTVKIKMFHLPLLDAGAFTCPRPVGNRRQEMTFYDASGGLLYRTSLYMSLTAVNDWTCILYRGSVRYIS